MSRIIALRPRDGEELKGLLVDARAGTLFPPMRARVAHGEQVLLDVRLPDMTTSIVFRCRAGFTFPEGTGPLFTCTQMDRAALDFLLGSTVNRSWTRAHVRYPVDWKIWISTQGSLRRLRGRLIELSLAGTRVELDQGLKAGSEILLGVDQTLPVPFPRQVTARVLGARGSATALHFSGPDLEAWRQLRCALRRVVERGQGPSA